MANSKAPSPSGLSEHFPLWTPNTVRPYVGTIDGETVPRLLQAFAMDSVWRLMTFRCQHTDTTLRSRVTRNGGIQYVQQCQRCGAKTSNPAPHREALANYGAQPPPRFDDELEERWQLMMEEAREGVMQKFEDEFWAEYRIYLKSQAWKAKCQAVIKRAKGVCEGCCNAPAQQVHHLSYDNVFDELLFQLVALCTPCHTRLHESRTRTHTDPALEAFRRLLLREERRAAARISAGRADAVFEMDD